MRVLVDANILIACFFRRERHAVMRLAAAGEIMPVLCPYVAREARRMVSRAFRGREAELDAVLEHLRPEWIADATPEQLAHLGRLVSDPADDPVLVAALLSGVDYLVTSDRTLHGDAHRSPTVQTAGLQVVSVPELVAAVKGDDGRE